jgi:hypothetical protein
MILENKSRSGKSVIDTVPDRDIAARALRDHEPSRPIFMASNVSTDLEYELSLEMARLAQAMGIGGLGQAIELDLRSAHHARLE